MPFIALAPETKSLLARYAVRRGRSLSVTTDGLVFVEGEVFEILREAARDTKTTIDSVLQHHLRDVLNQVQ